MLVPWMSGLVSGLQNRVRQFESARYLDNKIPKLLFYKVFRFFFRYREFFPVLLLKIE